MRTSAREEPIHPVRRAGRSLTRQREAILRELQGSGTHPTALELYDRVRAVMPRITLATVYRNLHVLCDLGLVRELDGGNGPSRFDATVHPHWHVWCSSCGNVADVMLQEPEDLDRLAQEASGYVITGHTLLFRGVCPQCQKRGKATRRPRGDKHDGTEG